MIFRILIADDEPAARFGMAKALAQVECNIIEAADGRAALEAIKRDSPDLVYLDLNMPGMDGVAVMQALSETTGTLPGEIIIVTANDDVTSAVACMKLGATDYITKPYEIERIRAIARRNARRVELEQRATKLQHQLDGKSASGTLLGISQPMRDLMHLLERAGPAPIDVLIRGETGTGKELIARELHRLSGRTGAFVAVNTAAISATLAESELFGHVKGAFTGAEADRKGVFEQAAGGTLFLDEIGDMPLPMQAKMLRVLQQRVVQRVGSAKEIAVDVRVISATHQDLACAVTDGHFREDLLYRIRGIELCVPPLRDRPQDIALLAEFFLDRFVSRSKLPVMRLTSSAMDALLRHPWPGNVRELEQVITASATLAAGTQLNADDLRLPTLNVSHNNKAVDFAALHGLPLTEAKSRLIDQYERHAIEAALKSTQGNVSAAARSLGIHRQNLQQKMTQMGIARDTE